MENEIIEQTEKTEKKESFFKKAVKWLNKDVKIKDVLIACCAPVCALIGVCYTADRRLDEKQLDLEVEKLKSETELEVAKIKANGEIEQERIRVGGRLKQLDRICSSSEEQLPDSLSLKLLNDNDK